MLITLPSSATVELSPPQPTKEAIMATAPNRENKLRFIVFLPPLFLLYVCEADDFGPLLQVCPLHAW
jgi:hypothetical protein